MGNYNLGDYPTPGSTNPVDWSNWVTRGFVKDGCDITSPLEAPGAGYTRFLATDGLRAVGYINDQVQGLIYDIQTGTWEMHSLPAFFDRGAPQQLGFHWETEQSISFVGIDTGTIIGTYSYVTPWLTALDFVWVEDTGNLADTNGYGAVSNSFGIGKHEVTVEQYAAFLNAVAASDPYGLYNTNMSSDLNVAGIARSGAPGSYSYSVIGSGKRPITYVSWFDAARFCNWLINGAANDASTETGAYNLSGATNGIFQKNQGAPCYIPSEDEWYKAAYYKGANMTNTNAGYWTYPTQSDVAPSNSVSTLPNQANFNNGLYSLTQSPSYSADQNYLTEVGAFTASPSAYGTFDQGGNVWEWNDAVDNGSRRGVRGGWYDDGALALRSSWRSSDLPTSEYKYLGFRVAGWQPVELLKKSFKFDGTNWASIQHPDYNFVEVTAIHGSKILGNCHKSEGPSRSRDYACFLLDGTNWTFFRPPFFNFSANNFEGTTIVGEWVDQSGLNGSVTHGFIFDGTNWTTVDFPEADGDTRFKAISNAKILGTYLSSCGETYSFTYTRDGGTSYSQSDYDLNRIAGQQDVISNPNAFGLYDSNEFSANRTNGQTEVINNPAAFALFTQEQYNSNRLAGQLDVTSNPMSYGLYTSNSIMDLRMGGLMIQRQGTNAAISFQPQTTTDLALPFTNNGTPINHQIPMPGNKGFIRIRANP